MATRMIDEIGVLPLTVYGQVSHGLLDVPIDVLKMLISTHDYKAILTWAARMRAWYEHQMMTAHMMMMYGVPRVQENDDALHKFFIACGYKIEPSAGQYKKVRFQQSDNAEGEYAIDDAVGDKISLGVRLERIHEQRLALKSYSHWQTVLFTQKSAGLTVLPSQLYPTDDDNGLRTALVKFSKTAPSEQVLDVVDLKEHLGFCYRRLKLKYKPRWAARPGVCSIKYSYADIISSISAFGHSRLWYLRNGYQQVKGKQTLVLKPCSIATEGHGLIQTPDATYSQIDSYMFKYVHQYEGPDGAQGNREDARVNRISQMMMELGGVSVEGIDTTRLLKHGEHMQLLTHMQRMYVQKFVPTTFVLDYDETKIYDLGIKKEKVDRLLRDQVVTLIPDYTTVSRELVEQVVAALKKMLAMEAPVVDGANFSERLYQELISYVQTIRGDGEQLTEGIRLLVYSCIKAVRINSKYSQKETLSMSQKDQIQALANYFEMLLEFAERQDLYTVVIDIQIPKYRVKYAECLQGITCNFIDFNSQRGVARFPLNNVHKKYTEQRAGQQDAFDVKFLYGQPVDAVQVPPVSLSMLTHSLQASEQMLRMSTAGSWGWGSLAISQFVTQQFMYPLVNPQFGLTTNMVYKRKQVVPGLHLLQFLDRGRYSVEVGGGIRASLKGSDTVQAARVYGMLHEARTLLTGVNPRAFREPDYDDGHARVTAVSGLPRLYVKGPHLNLMAKTQVRMMQLMYNQGEFNVRTSTDAGLAAAQWRSVSDAIGVLGAFTSKPDDHQYVVSLSGLLGVEVAGGQTWSPLAAGGLSEDGKVSILTPKGIKAQLGIDDLGPRSLVALCLAHRLRTSFEQQFRMSVDIQRLLQTKNDDQLVQAFSAHTKGKVQLVCSLPKGSRFDLMNNMIAVRNQAFISLALYGVNPASAAAKTIFEKHVDAMISGRDNLNLQTLVRELIALSSVQALQVETAHVPQIAKNFARTLYVNKDEQTDDQMRDRTVLQYRLNSQASFLASALQVYMKKMKKFYMRHQYNPYWVDCYFGAYLSLGEQTNNDFHAQLFGEADWTNHRRDVVRQMFSMFGGQPVEAHAGNPCVVQRERLAEADSLLLRVMLQDGDRAQEERLLFNLQGIGAAQSALRYDDYCSFDKQFKESSSDPVINFTVSDPSCTKFTTDMSIYDLPLYIPPTAGLSHLQSLFTNEMAKRAQPQGNFGRKMTFSRDNVVSKYYQATLTQPVWNMFKSVGVEGDKTSCIPITILERITFLHLTERSTTAYLVQLTGAFLLMFKHYSDLMEMYVTCSYKKISDYDLYFLLCNMQSYLQEFGSVVVAIATGSVLDMAQIAEQFTLGRLTEAERSAVEAWMKKLSDSFLQIHGLEITRQLVKAWSLKTKGPLLALFAVMPHYRIAEDRFEAETKLQEKARKATFKRQREILTTVTKEGHVQDLGRVLEPIGSVELFAQQGYKPFVTAVSALQQVAAERVSRENIVGDNPGDSAGARLAGLYNREPRLNQQAGRSSGMLYLQQEREMGRARGTFSRQPFGQFERPPREGSLEGFTEQEKAFVNAAPRGNLIERDKRKRRVVNRSITSRVNQYLAADARQRETLNAAQTEEVNSIMRRLTTIRARLAGDRAGEQALRQGEGASDAYVQSVGRVTTLVPFMGSVAQMQAARARAGAQAEERKGEAPVQDLYAAGAGPRPGVDVAALNRYSQDLLLQFGEDAIRDGEDLVMVDSEEELNDGRLAE